MAADSLRVTSAIVRFIHDHIYVNRRVRSITVPSVLAELLPVRPNSQLRRAIERTGALRILTRARPLVLLESGNDGPLDLIAGLETWALLHDLDGRLRGSFTGRAWLVQCSTLTAAEIAAVLRLFEVGLQARCSRRQLAEIVGPVAGPLLQDGSQSRRTLLARILGISRQTLYPRAPAAAPSASGVGR